MLLLAAAVGDTVLMIISRFLRVSNSDGAKNEPFRGA